MGMGIPVVCNNIGDTGRIIQSTGTGVVVNAFTEATLEKAVAALPALEAIDKEAIRQAAFRYFDLERGAGHYQQVYERILGKKEIIVGRLKS
jgi:glycosyltransferase involved in cell wall biosynthesis